MIGRRRQRVRGERSGPLARLAAAAVLAVAFVAGVTGCASVNPSVNVNLPGSGGPESDRDDAPDQLPDPEGSSQAPDATRV